MAKQFDWKTTLSISLSVAAILLATIAICIPFIYDPLGKGIAGYDFSTPRASLVSELEMEIRQDIRAQLDRQRMQRDNRLEEMFETLKVHKESTHEDQRLLFVSFEKNGITMYDVRAFKKDADTGYWFTKFLLPSSIDDSVLKKAIEEWEAKTGSVEVDE
ncbi:MAG: hypothetical protein N2C14_30545 [Planctomycetales bacterium]